MAVGGGAGTFRADVVGGSGTTNCDYFSVSRDLVGVAIRPSIIDECPWAPRNNFQNGRQKEKMTVYRCHCADNATRTLTGIRPKFKRTAATTVQ